MHAAGAHGGYLGRNECGVFPSYWAAHVLSFLGRRLDFRAVPDEIRVDVRRKRVVVRRWWQRYPTVLICVRNRTRLLPSHPTKERPT